MVLNFNSDEEITGSRNETGDSPKDGKFTFAEPKGPVRGKLPKPFSGRSFSDPSPQVVLHMVVRYCSSIVMFILYSNCCLTYK